MESGLRTGTHCPERERKEKAVIVSRLQVAGTKLPTPHVGRGGCQRNTQIVSKRVS